MRSTFRICAALVGAVFLAPAAYAQAACKPVVGSFQAAVVPPGAGHCPPVAGTLCTAGRVWGGIQGTYQFVMSAATPAAPLGGTPTVLFFTGRSTIALRDGEQLLGGDTGSLDPPPAGLGGFASLITFDGGTGAMANARGQIRLRGELGADGTTGDYLGVLCTP